MRAGPPASAEASVGVPDRRRFSVGAAVIVFGIALVSPWLGCGRRSSPGHRLAADYDTFTYYNIIVHRPFFVPDPEDPSRYVTREPIGRGPERFAGRKPPGLKRVFVLGGSVAQLYEMEPGGTTLKGALEASLPGKTFEVVNCGMSGYGSARDLLIAEDVLRHDPDLLVVMSGPNEYGQRVLPRCLSGVCGVRPFRWLCEGGMALANASLDGTAARRAEFEKNLRRLAAAARERGVPLVFCALPVCMRDMPPPGVLPLHDRRFLGAWLDYERGRYEAAAAGFESFVSGRELGVGSRARWRRAMGLFYMAKSLDRLGRLEEARARYVEAQDLHRPVPLMNATIREIARSEGAVVADVEMAFGGLSPIGVPGSDLFESDVHWDRRLDPVVTAEIVRALSDGARAGVGLSLATAGAWRDDWLKRNEGRILRGAREVRAGGRARSWRVFRYHVWKGLEDERLLYSERVLALLDNVRAGCPTAFADVASLRRWIEDGLEGNIWEKDAVAGLASWWPNMLAHAGELQRRRGDDSAAARFLGAALDLRPGLRRARLSKAFAHLAGGEVGAAESALEHLRGWRRDPEVLARLEACGWAPGQGHLAPLGRASAAGTDAAPARR